ncbi:asparagine synthase (glutamine-hydrolyzing) [Paenibacillus antri]|uniref:asparagine synthase (glutamine-hydrolyzing) n=1 Tax=Paenibacillus antri TaxID=2582848 RepID=A0A5R9G103_9BACL|nr:asparagine synthase (glutamine-hydrolyzing) [Paenibacillus antri]TLS50007.1 asparagine synthase (glutamine-hydrolyzing) [Paenibacillus antri]
MCGIVGLMYFGEGKAETEVLGNMTETIMHRGPDDVAYHFDGQIGLGFRRLSIIDIDEGRQPCSNEDGTVWLVFNGEIYNYKELRSMLIEKGHRFSTQSDSETIVHLYEEYGGDCVDYLRGMFAFAIWDSRTRTLFAARDHFGIKPFYYVLDQEGFVFASEIKALIASGRVNKTVRMESLVAYLTFQYVPQPNTMFSNVHQLQAGHCMRVDSDGRVQVSKYWSPIFEPSERSMNDYIEDIRESLRNSVEFHMQSDVLRGCFLSSGIDSSAIAAHMNSFESIRTFSVGFEGSNNETVIAGKTASVLGTDHYDHIISEEEYFGSVRKTVWHQDDPVADPAAVALYHVARLAKEHVTVVLSGEGADELFGGYRIYREPNSLRALSWLPSEWKQMMKNILTSAPWSFTGKNYLIRAFTPLEQRFFGNANIFHEDAKQDLLTNWEIWFHKVGRPSDITKKIYQESVHHDSVTRMQLIDLNLWLTGDILMKADKMTMAHSLELRVPFLDKEVFEAAKRIPAHYRIAKGTTKLAFRKAMEGVVPDFVVNRPKLGFPVPLRDWLRNKERMSVIREQLLMPSMARYFHLPYIDRMVQDHLTGRGDFSRKLWVLYIFSLWHEMYIEH